MSKELKTFKFMAMSSGQHPQWFNIKALRSDTAEKKARERIAKLELKTGLTWTLEKEPPPISQRGSKFRRAMKIKRYVNDAVSIAMNSLKGSSDKIIAFYKTAEYQAASLGEQALMSLAFAHKELVDNEKIDDTEKLSEALKLALEQHPLFIRAEKICRSSDLLVWWFKNAQAEIQGEVPWLLMQSKDGLKKVQRALLHFCRIKASMMIYALKAQTSPKRYRVTVSKSGEIKLPKEICNAYHYSGGKIVDIVSDEGNVRIYPASGRPRAYKKLFKMATELLESKDAATLWLHRSQPGLGGFRPIDYMFTDEGAKEVESLIVRIEHGVY